MRTIWKFPLVFRDKQVISMPDKAHILTVQMQDDTLCLWALISPDKPMRQRVIQMYDTGEPARDAGVYIATIQYDSQVIHVFEDRTL